MRKRTVLVTDNLSLEDDTDFLLEDGDTLELEDSVSVEADVATFATMDYNIRVVSPDRVSVPFGIADAMIYQDANTMVYENGDRMTFEASLLAAVKIKTLPADNSIRN
jgi:hypothetical protein